MKSTVVICRLHYATSATRRNHYSPWMFELLDLLLALTMLAMIFAIMAAGSVLLILQEWTYAGITFVGIPAVIIICLEASDALGRARDRISR